MVIGLTLAVWTSGLLAQRPKRGDGDLKVGDAAADFTLHDTDRELSVTLSDLKGKPVVLIFGSCT